MHLRQPDTDSKEIQILTSEIELIVLGRKGESWHLKNHVKSMSKPESKTKANQVRFFKILAIKNLFLYDFTRQSYFCKMLQDRVNLVRFL